MKIIFLSMCLVMSSAVFARAKVLKVRGDVTFGAHKVTPGATLKGEGELVVGEDGYLKILLEESQSTMAFAFNTKATINMAIADSLPEVSLARGYMRWLTGAKAQKGTGSIRTRNVAMGIRGTDFYVVHEANLNETEIICFDGSVMLTELTGAKSEKLVSKNQWGGLGGRFGDKLKVLDLPKDFVEFMNKVMPIQ